MVKGQNTNSTWSKALSMYEILFGHKLTMDRKQAVTWPPITANRYVSFASILILGSKYLLRIEKVNFEHSCTV